MAGLLCIVSCTNSTNPGTAGNTVSATPVTAQVTPSVVTAAPPASDGSSRISLADAKKDFDAGTAVFIDTHTPEQFAIQHIEGAINIPASDIGTRADSIPKGKKIVAYCS